VKKTYLLLLLLTVFLQGNAQVETFARVRLSGDPVTFLRAIQAGLSLDHTHLEDGGRIAELSASEIALAKQAGLTVETQIGDLSRFYAERAAKDLQANVLRTQGTTPVPPGFNLGSMGGFLTFDEVLLELDSMLMQYPQLVSRRDSIGSTHEGRAIWMLKISDHPSLDESEPEVFYNALHHAREPISMMQLIFFMQHILDQYGQDPMITHLINERELYFIPVVNPDGYVYNQVNNPNGGGMWRKNRNPSPGNAVGVDLNRNYGYEWGYDNIGSSGSTTSSSYRGPAPFSELETQCIRRFCMDREFATGLSFHGYGEYYVHPWGYDPQVTLAEQPFYNDMNPTLYAENHYYPGNASETVDYPANGVFDDWMIGEVQVKAKAITLSPELGNSTDGFWPAPSRIPGICDQQLAANLRIARLTGPCVDLQPRTPEAIGGNPLAIDFRLHNSGLAEQAPFRATFVSAHPAVTTVSAPINFGAMTPDMAIDASFQIGIQAGTPAGELITGEIQLELATGLITSHPIAFRYQVPLTLFFDDAEQGGGLWTGTWASTMERAFSGQRSFTDSPFQNYGPFANEPYSLVQPVDLSGHVDPMLRFQAYWNVDHSTDYVLVEASEDGLTYQPLPGRLSWEGVGPGQPLGSPLYEGRRYVWEEERIPLTAYEGKQLYLRFSLHSNSWREREGFYFDDITITAYPKPVVGLPTAWSLSASLAPNPSNGTLRLVADAASADSYDIEVRDLTGRQVWQGSRSTGQNLSLDMLAKGAYYYRITSDGQHSAWQNLILR
jgi:carboxypeptidase T